MKKQKRNKVIKSIIAIVLIACFLISLITIDKNNIKNSPKITEQEWAERLYDSLGLQSENTNTCSKNPATGRFIAITTGEALDKTGKIDYQNKTDEEHIQLLIESGVLSRSQLNVEYSYNAANKVLTKVMDLYFDLDNYPNYCDINYKDNVNKPEETKIISIDNDNNKIKANFSSDVPSEGDIITYKDEFGILNAKRVELIKEETGNTYSIIYSNIEDLSEIIDEISFSGTADFSQLPDNNNPQDENSIVNDKPNVVQANVLPISSSLFSNGPIIDNVSEWLEDNTTISSYSETKSTDIEMYFKLSSKAKSGADDVSATAETSIQIKPEGEKSFTKGLKYEIDENDKETISTSVSINDIKAEYEKKIKDKDKKDDIGIPDTHKEDLPKGSAKVEATGKITLKNTKIVASGYFVTTNWDSEKNYVQVFIESDIDIDIISTGTFNGKVKIAELPLPLPSTGGAVSVNLNVYLDISLTGEITLEFGLDDCYAGIDVSIKDGISLPHNHSRASLDYNSKIQFTAGFAGEGELKVFGITLADPEITTKLLTSVETLSKEPGYEQYPPCVQTSIKAPLIELKISNDEDSITGTIIDRLNGSLSYKLITKENIEEWKDNPLVINKNYHIETDKYGKMNTLEGTKDVCTHKLANKYSEDLSLNPDATSVEINANSLHYSGFVLEPKDVVLKCFDAVKSADYISAIECYDPTTEKIINALGTITSGLNSAITGNYVSFGELLSNKLGPLDYEIIECETQKYYYDSSSDLINGVFTNIPVINNFICTAADVRVKYRYFYNDQTKVFEETCRVNRYSGSGWRINANSITSTELGGN